MPRIEFRADYTATPWGQANTSCSLACRRQHAPVRHSIAGSRGLVVVTAAPGSGFRGSSHVVRRAI